MRKFISNLFIFLIFACVFYLIALILSGKTLPSFLKVNLISDGRSFGGFMSLRVKDIKNKNKLDVLFLGSSHTYRGFDTRIFDKYNLNTFNFGSSSQTPIQTLVLLKRYLNKVHPKLVIYEVHPSAFSSDGVESSLDLNSNDIIDVNNLKMSFTVNNIKTYNTLIYYSIINLFGWSKGNDLRTRGDDTYIDGGFVERKISYYRYLPIAQNEIIYEPNQMNAFKCCLIELKARHIPYILIYSPVTKNYYSSFPQNNSFGELMSRFGEFYDFNRRISMNDSFYFYDQEHLNQNGVDLFDVHLINLVRKDKLIF